MTTGSHTYTFRREGSPGCLWQILWFIFIGWWLGLIALAAAWFLNITIVGLPLGLAILNRLPMFVALQTPTTQVILRSAGGRSSLLESGLPQYNFFLRALYFLLIGWWWSLIWLLVAYLFCASVILLPLGIVMFRLTPFMTTLKRY